MEPTCECGQPLTARDLVFESGMCYACHTFRELEEEEDPLDDDWSDIEEQMLKDFEESESNPDLLEEWPEE